MKTIRYWIAVAIVFMLEKGIDCFVWAATFLGEATKWVEYNWKTIISVTVSFVAAWLLRGWRCPC